MWAWSYTLLITFNQQNYIAGNETSAFRFIFVLCVDPHSTKVAGVMILLFLAFIMITTVQVPVKLTALLFGGLLISLFLVAMLILFRKQ